MASGTPPETLDLPLTRRLRPSRDVLVFGVVGAIGFCVDGGVLTLLVNGFGVDSFGARALSFTAAVLVTWLLNRHVTFHERKDACRLSELGRYVGTQLAGAIANLAVYALCLWQVSYLRTWPVIALAIGAAAGFIVNYAGARLIVFSRSPQP